MRDPGAMRDPSPTLHLKPAIPMDKNALRPADAGKPAEIAARAKTSPGSAADPRAIRAEPTSESGIGSASHRTHGEGFRFGVDLGGTKVESLLLDPLGAELWRKRAPTPRGDYAATVRLIVALRDEALHKHPEAAHCSIGLGIPGSLGTDARVRNANSVWLNGRPFAEDLAQALGQDVAMANDANCLALSEAVDGAGADATSVFAVILGTGVGGGVVMHRKLWEGRAGLAGEWGHVSLPWPRSAWGECPGPQCWCGQRGCIESFLCGPALAQDAGSEDAQSVVRASHERQTAALQAVERYLDRLARSLAMVINILDPEVIVLGGGLSQFAAIYQQVPERWAQWIFSNQVVPTRLVPARHGDASGVRGAAWLGAAHMQR